MAIGDCGQRLVIDVDPRRGILGEIRSIGDHHGDWLANIDCFVLRQDRAIPLLFVSAIGKRHGETVGRHVIREIVRNDHRMNARHRKCRVLADRQYPGVCVRAAHECGVKHAGRSNIVDKAPVAANKLVILNPWNPLADRLIGHAAIPSSRA